jgi:uncharacterized FAD-dependent dehydrogenase
MGFRQLQLKMPTDFAAPQLRKKIAKKLHIKEFSYTLEKQSLDARNRRNIHWQMRVGVSSPELKGPDAPPKESLDIPRKKRNKRVIVVGSGPAGFFAGYTLLKAGFQVTLLEQGSFVGRRFKEIKSFERTGKLNERNNYAFGEGGAGTFSDGKLSSRTKSISLERGFIFDTYVEAGAPPEISWLSHPHLGSDNLRKIAKNLGESFIDLGGSLLFETRVEDIHLENTKQGARVKAVETDQGKLEADYFIFAAGHSAYDTYRLLIKRGVGFRVKGFALGCRVEHRQELINVAQWSCVELPGVKAAEYRLTFKREEVLPVYSFCMCPGGKVVPAAAYEGTNIVNGMSNYRRSGLFANAAVVAGVRLDRLLEKELDALEALEWVSRLERTFYDFSGSYKAPSCKISEFLNRRTPDRPGETSYPMGLVAAELDAFFPGPVTEALRVGLADFCRRMKGFEEGTMLGLESKTSSPVQAIRDRAGRSEGIENLYISGEGSGFSGGIVSSAADGIKAAMDIISRHS